MSEPVLHHADPKPAKSKGEKLFDRTVYAGLAGIGTLIVTVPLAHRLQHQWGWSQYLLGKFERGVAWGMEKLFSPELSKKIAKEATDITALMEGGNVMLLPVGLAEHYKVPLVSKANAMLGDDTPPETISEAPKQTWMSLIQGRLTAFAVVLGSVLGTKWLLPKTFSTYVNEMGERAAQLFKRPTHAPEAGKIVETLPYKYGKLAAVDVFATAAAAALLYVGGHFFARKHEEKVERKLEKKAHAAGHLPHPHHATPLLTAEAAPTLQISGEKAHRGALQPEALQTQERA